MTILRKLSGVNIIEPIEWKQYEGETVVVNTIIRKGKRIQETEFYKDKVKAVPRGNAYCIGNGPSRKNIDLTKLDGLGANKRPKTISLETLMNSKIK